MADGPQVVRTDDDYPETYTKPLDSNLNSNGEQSKAMHYYDRAAASDIKEESYPEVVPEQRRTILGLRRRNFWILVAGALVVLGAAIGGSVGGTLAVRYSKVYTPAAASSSPSPSSAPSASSASASVTGASASASPTAATYSVLPLAQVLSINVTCPSKDLSSLAGDPNTAGAQYACTNNAAFTAPSSDIFSFTAYSLQQCIDACSQFNYVKPRNRCDAIVTEGNLNEGDLGRWKRGNGANCWLKQNASDSDFVPVTGSTAVRLME